MATHVLPHHEPLSPELKKGLRLRVTQLGLQYAITGALMFACAGDVRWGRGWLYLASFLVSVALIGLWVWPRNPGVIAERARLHKDTKGFDKVVIPVLTVCAGAIYVVGALDNGRFHWAPLSWSWSLGGLVLLLLSMVPVAAAMAVNPRLATTVRVEKEGHALATTGPYAIVRHPMYAGSLLQYPALALVLGSTWALVPAAACIVVVVVRTVLEDRTLHRELEGYAAYARRTRYRLVPGLW